MKVFGIFFLLASFSATAHAAGQCGNKITFALQLSNYSFNSGSQQQLNATVTKNGGPACSFFVAISHGGASDYNRKLFKTASTISYQLYTGNPFNFVVKDIPDATSNTDILPGSLAAGSTHSQTVSYWAVLGATDYLPWGAYFDTVTVKLYSGTVNGTFALEQSQSMTFSYAEPKQIDLSLVSSGGAFDIASTSMNLNFGTLTQGKSLGFDVVMKYNAGYSLAVSSQNAGKLVASGLATTVPYTLSANGAATDLSGGPARPAVISTGRGVSASSGTRIPIAVTIGNPGTALAGSYSDFLTLTVTSTE